MRSSIRLASQQGASLGVLPQCSGPHIAGQPQVHVCLGTVTQRWEQGRPGQCCVTMCQAVRSQASVSLFVQGGC